MCKKYLASLRSAGHEAVYLFTGFISKMLLFVLHALKYGQICYDVQYTSSISLNL